MGLEVQGYNMNIHEFIISKGVLFGSRAFGFANADSDYDYYLVEDDYSKVMAELLSRDIGFCNAKYRTSMLLNDRALKVTLDGMEFNLLGIADLKPYCDTNMLYSSMLSGEYAFKKARDDKGFRNSLYEWCFERHHPRLDWCL